MAEKAARQEAERSISSDKNIFLQQAMLKYIETLSGANSVSTPAYSPWTAMFTQQFQPPLAAPPQLSGIPPPSPVSGVPPSYSYPTQPNSKLQQLLQGISNVVASKSIPSVTNTGPADVIAAAHANLSRSRSSRFDISSSPPSAAPMAPQESYQSYTQSFSPYPPQMFNLQAQSKPPTSLVNVDALLQAWKYQVFNSHRTAPPGLQGNEWRSRLKLFVECRDRQVRETHATPHWLRDCLKPTVDEILNETKSVGLPDIPPLSVFSPNPPPPATDSLSPVSSSDDSSTQSRSKHRGKRRRSTSTSSMSKSSTSSVPKRSSLFEIDKHGHKRVRLSVPEEYIQLGNRTGRKKKTKAERKASRIMTTAEERRKRDDRLRRFGCDEPSSSPFFDQEVGLVMGYEEIGTDWIGRNGVLVVSSALTTSEGLRMMSWQEKLAMLTSRERVVGLSQLLEKSYLRLCGPPDPALVRPEAVLVKSLRHCLERWKKERDYRFIEEQFRSIRQDLTVQGIRNAFTTQVYETNARVALENSDLGQFNQCQTQLRELHKSMNLPLEESHREEFLCYRILYLSLMNMRHDLLKLSGELTTEEKRLKGVQFADAFRRASVEGNLHRVLKLTAKGPFLSSTLINIFINRLRMTYLVLIARAHYTANLSFLKDELMFSTEAECKYFLSQAKAVWTSSDSLDCKKSFPLFEASPLLQARKVQALG
ncbi:leukocyte receptor cluster member 8 homolog [Condylostylus longicornis]|uniref:leukocyte receptor cluster member 8 homolog n=1 Tax=Condylostylus longicornis TaxID=2530218 RepID=UPI00244DD4B8|nr:leukocyte receptor cluster member 8 homolog [Condylostylus longicornis]